MRWPFGNQPDQDPEALRRAAESLNNIRMGRLPVAAIERLTEQGRQRDFFTSDLTPAELHLTHQCGFIPVGQVMGSSVYHVGWQYLPQNAWVMDSKELAVLTQAQLNARTLAFGRLRQEARLLKADGVVGVRFTIASEGLEEGNIEFKAIGTAVRIADGVGSEEPFLSNLSGQDHWMLRQGGYAPVGFCFGTCVWFQYPNFRTQVAMASWSNAEATSLTQGIYTAREFAQERLWQEAKALRADGVVGVDFNVSVHRADEATHQDQQVGYIMHASVWGTAISRHNYRQELGEVQKVAPLSNQQENQT